jgi:hypothetical protein
MEISYFVSLEFARARPQERTSWGNPPDDCWSIDPCSLRTFENRVRPTLQSPGPSIDPKNSS